MRSFFLSDPCKETQLHTFNPQSWLQVERGKLSKFSHSPSSIESLIKVAEPSLLPLFKPIDYVEVLAQIHEELESCAPHDRSKLYLLQFQVFRGLGEVKLLQRSLRSALDSAATVYERLIFGAWLKYEKQDEEPISNLLASCGKCSQEFDKLDISSQIPIQTIDTVCSCSSDTLHASTSLIFQVGEVKTACDRQKIAALSTPFHTMLNGCFAESTLELIDLSENGISPIGMSAINEFSYLGILGDLAPEVILEILIFANKFCCERLKDACDRKMASLVSSRQDAIDLMECALDENSPVLAAVCLQVFLYDLPDCLNDNQVVKIFSNANERQRSIMVNHASFSLYCLLSEVAMNMDPSSDITARFLEKLVESATDYRQKQLAFHWLGCVRLLRKEYVEAESLFDAAFSLGHVYSIAGLARIASIEGDKILSYDKLSSIISSYEPLGWMYEERSLYAEDESKWEDLNKATVLDPTLLHPYMYRAASLMRKQSAEAALMEINRVLGFKLALECLELRFCFYLALEDYRAALCDVQAILTLSPGYKMFEGRVVAHQLRTLVREHVDQWTTADCWLQLYDRWSSVDDTGSLSVIYQMLDSTDAHKGVLYFRQSLLLLRLNCPEAAMHSLQLARQHAASEHERLVYEGWILYDTGHCEEGLQKAEQSISIQRSFEAFFLKAYALADSSSDPSNSATVVALLEDALKCPSDRLRKGQALNNLGSVYVDCGKLDLAADCYINALKIRHTRAHQGLARVHFLKNDRNAAYEEMTKLIEKARNNASAYEKRSEYCDRELTKADLQMVTKLDPLRVYPYRYRAAVLMDNHKEKEAIAELTRAIAFKADLHLLHLRAAFHEHIGDVQGALRDCRAALSVDPNHQEMLLMVIKSNSVICVYDCSSSNITEIRSIEIPSLLAAVISPCGTYLQTFQKSSTPQDKNVVLWDINTGVSVYQLFQKNMSKTTWPTIQFSADESIACRMATNEIQFFDAKNFAQGIVSRLRIPGVAAVELSKAPGSHIAAYIAESKGIPASVQIFSSDKDAQSQPLARRSFFRCSSVQFHWNNGSTALLAIAQSDVDKTNQSYYGESKLNYLTTDGSHEGLVPLSKEGPVHDVQWSASGLEFAVVYGFMPAKATIFNKKCNPLLELGMGPYNTIRWNPKGKFICVAGFGNLPGEMAFWDYSEKKLLGTTRAECSVTSEWSPDGCYFMTATTAPRLQIDNCIKIFHHNGSLYFKKMFDKLYQADWKPEAAERFGDIADLIKSVDTLTIDQPKKQVQDPKSSQSSSKTTTSATQKPAAYRTPHAKKATAVQAEIFGGITPSQGPSKNALRNQKRREKQKEKKAAEGSSPANNS